MSKYEEDKASYEYERNKFIDRYFKARPQILRTIEKEKFLEAGFLAGKEQAKKDISEWCDSDQMITAEQAVDLIAT